MELECDNKKHMHMCLLVVNSANIFFIHASLHVYLYAEISDYSLVLIIVSMTLEKLADKSREKDIPPKRKTHNDKANGV